MRYVLGPAFFVLVSSQVASAQLLITEVHPNPNPAMAPDNAEFIELHNIGTTTITLEGYTLNDFVGMSPTGESTTRWTFPATATIAPDQVVVIARQGAAVLSVLMVRADFELDEMVDDPLIPNLEPSGGMTLIQLGNDASGDGVILRDDTGAVVDEMEWGNVDRSVLGIPQSARPGKGGSLVRIQDTGSTNVDFIVVNTPSPGVGFAPSAGPVISMPRTEPRHIRYDGNIRFEATVNDPDGLGEVSVFYATSTSSTGPAAQDYTSVAMTATTTSEYRRTETVNALGFPEPADFHSRYIRYFFSAEDTTGTLSRNPENADEAADNTEYLLRNVMPNAPSSIQDVREQDANRRAIWVGHSATIRGVALSSSGVLGPGRLDIAVQDASGWGIRVFNPNMEMITVRAGDLVEAVGTIDQFRGVMQLGGGRSEIRLLGGTGATETSTLTIAELLANVERYESTLVHIANVDFENTTPTWPSEGSGGNVTIKDDTGTITVRVTSGTDLFGQAAPQYGFHITGVVGQFASEVNATMDGYQIFPRGSQDIVAKPMPPPPDGGVSMNDGGTGGGDGGTGGRTDAGTGGGGNPPAEDDGCGCTTADVAAAGAPTALSALAFVAVALISRRRR